MIEIDWNPTRRFLRQFAALFVLFFWTIGAWRYWGKDQATVGIVLAAIGCLGIVGYFLTPMMRVIYVTWMTVLFPVGWVVSHVVLSLVFFLVLTPVGVIMRLFGYDPMRKRFDRSAESYWRRRDGNRDVSRYFRQF